VVSHVAALMGSTGVVTRYVNSHVISLYHYTLELNSPCGMETFLYKAVCFIFVDFCKFRCIVTQYQYSGQQAPLQ
jgi:hypothetical protein